MRTAFDSLAAALADRAAGLATQADPTPQVVRSTHRPWIVVLDEAVPCPFHYRREVLEQSFGEVAVAGAVFHGIAPLAKDRLKDVLRRLLPTAQPTLTFARQSPLGQAEPNFIHTDADMGEWSAILYLHPDPPAGDGTIFWRHRATGATTSAAWSAAEQLAEALAWRDVAQWEPWHTVRAHFNRLAVFESTAFHARALPENYGAGDDARLIQVMFGRWL